MTVLTSDRLGSMDDDELAALYTQRFQGRLLSDLLNEEDESLLQEVDRRAAHLEYRRVS
jgi:hypothetical protein